MYIVFNSHFLEDAHLLCMIVYRVHDFFAACFDTRLCIPQFIHGNLKFRMKISFLHLIIKDTIFKYTISF